MVNYFEFIDYFNNKSIAVIGSGASVLNHEYGQEIENHDIIVRINRGYPYVRYKKFVGNRTDVWSFGMGGREDLRKKMHLLFSDRKYSLYCWFDSSWVPDYLRMDARHLTLPPHFSEKASIQCGGVPATTGVDTIHFLITGTNYKSISIYGIDNYKTGYWFIEEDDSIKPTVISSDSSIAHSVQSEEALLYELIKHNKGIVWVK